jgi:hypothetical protein
MEKILYFNTVHIIESLKPDDYHTGRRLLEDLEPITMTTTPQVSIQYSSVRTRKEFLDLLRSISKDARKNSNSPILHIEAHGSSSGIQVGSGECLTWAEIKPELIALNKISKLNLLVMMYPDDNRHSHLVNYQEGG